MLMVLQEHTQETIGKEEAQIFEAHRMFLTDPVFADEIKQIIHEEHINAEAAVERVSNGLIAEFEAIDDDYFRQRKGDIKDVAQRLLRRGRALVARGGVRLHTRPPPRARSGVARRRRRLVPGIPTVSGWAHGIAVRSACSSAWSSTTSMVPTG
jgi:hypothetical protein